MVCDTRGATDDDAEAQVIAIQPSQGRLAGKMGSIEVRTLDGRRFSIGSGFSDEDRANPPPEGSWVTCRFNGLMATGLPRFARFMRVRPEGLRRNRPHTDRSAEHSLPPGFSRIAPLSGLIRVTVAYAPCELAHCMMPDVFIAPAWRAISRPPRNKARVGMLRML